ncbi:hypothetical protein ON010_g17519 [Phytophthora cinnamomi]|nr:hypothetical protein ON010_g17519 [Phytophthora cinnamomi]
MARPLGASPANPFVGDRRGTWNGFTINSISHDSAALVEARPVMIAGKANTDFEDYDSRGALKPIGKGFALMAPIVLRGRRWTHALRRTFGTGGRRGVDLDRTCFVAAAALALLQLPLGVHHKDRDGQHGERDARDDHDHAAGGHLGLARQNGGDVGCLLADVRQQHGVRDVPDGRRHGKPRHRHVGDGQAVDLDNVGDARELVEQHGLPARTVEHLGEGSEGRELGAQVAADHLLAHGAAQQERQRRTASLAHRDHQHRVRHAEERASHHLQRRGRQTERHGHPEDQDEGQRAQHQVVLHPRRDGHQVRVHRQQRQQQHCTSEQEAQDRQTQPHVPLGPGNVARHADIGTRSGPPVHAIRCAVVGNRRGHRL